MTPATAAGVIDTGGEAAAFARERGITVVEAERRLGWQTLAPDLHERLASSLPSFGGVWIAAGDGDRVKVGDTGGGAAEIHRLAAAVGLTEGYDIVPVDRSWAWLQQSVEWLGQEIVRVNPGGPAGLMAGVRTDLNAIQLDIPSAPTPAQQAVASAARQRLGSGLAEVRTTHRFGSYACQYPLCDRPLRAGIRIDYAGQGRCTGGFTARSRTDARWYVVTAGHCLRKRLSDWSTAWVDGTADVIGPPEAFQFNAYGDMGIIRISQEKHWLPRPWVHVTDGPDTSADQAYKINADKLSVLGMRICATGAFYGRSDCGYVNELDVTADVGDGITVNFLGLTSVCGIEGDSGAPMYAKHIAYGVVVGGPVGGGCETLYQGIRAVENKLGIDVLHES
jgi:hypothetical protein